MKYIYGLILGLAVVAGVAVGIWQLYVIFSVIYPEWGIAGLIAAYLLFPLAMIGVPLYLGFGQGEWAYLLFYPAALLVYTVGSIAWALLNRRRGYA